MSFDGPVTKGKDFPEIERGRGKMCGRGGELGRGEV